MKLVLIGYMGSGKTSIGRLLSSTLGYPFLDLDQEIEIWEKMSISQIFTKKGEIYFRKKETEVLQSILNSKDKLILATGGGSPSYGSNMNDLIKHEEVITIYLRSSLEELTERLSNEKSTRPLIGHLDSKEELKEFIGKHLFERTHFYNQAKLIVDTEDMSISEITEQIIARLFE